MKNYYNYGRKCSAMLNAFSSETEYCQRKRLHEAVGYYDSHDKGDNPPKLPRWQKSIRDYLYPAMAAGLVDQPEGSGGLYHITAAGRTWRDRVNFNQDYESLGRYIWETRPES